MIRISFLTKFVLAVVTIGAGVMSAAADETPFHAQGLRQHVSIEHVHGGLHVVAAVPDGESNVGAWAGLADNYIHGNGVIGSMTIAFDPENTLTVAFMQVKDPHLGDFGGSVGIFAVTGGTGQFAGATGSGTMDAIWLDKSAVDVLIVLDGTIDF